MGVVIRALASHMVMSYIPGKMAMLRVGNRKIALCLTHQSLALLAAFHRHRWWLGVPGKKRSVQPCALLA